MVQIIIICYLCNVLKNTQDMRKSLKIIIISVASLIAVLLLVSLLAGPVAKSYINHKEREDAVYLGEDREHLVLYAKKYIEDHPNIDYFIFGHRHIELDIKIERHTRLMILGDWISQFTYAVYDGEHMFLEEYVEGESQP